MRVGADTWHSVGGQKEAGGEGQLLGPWAGGYSWMAVGNAGEAGDWSRHRGRVRGSFACRASAGSAVGRCVLRVAEACPWAALLPQPPSPSLLSQFGHLCEVSPRLSKGML